MITRTRGNLIDADVEALVNTVNTVGIMGKGIALQFRQAFPENYDAYRSACEHDQVQPGSMFVFDTGRLMNPRYIINFPTKRHWRGKSRIEDIESGLKSLVVTIRQLGISSVAVPPLGCGNGGLRWSDVRPRIEAALSDVPDVTVLLYEPSGAPPAETMKVATKRPRMTLGRAALIRLLELYRTQEYRLSLLETQKLAYFLQMAGEPLKLRFTKNIYGPYAENLNHVLQRIEGHYTRGYGDRSRDTPIHLLPGATSDAINFLEDHPRTMQRLNRVAQLIEGFETPFSMELLATVHWVTQENPTAREDVNVAIESVQQWSQRKKETFQPEHIRIAWQHLKDLGWFEPV